MLVNKITCPAIVGFLFLIPYAATSQSGSIPKYEAGLNIGAYVYQGDLTPHRLGSVETVQPGIGISGTRILNERFSVRAMFVFATLAANESVYAFPDWRKQRNFAFTASVKELGLSLHWNVFGTNYEAVRYEPYVFAGAAAAMISTYSDYSRVNWYYFGEVSEVGSGLAVDATKPSRKIIPVVPVGAGARYHISNRIVLNLEGAYRFMHNDYVDGFSKSANPVLKDHYWSVTIGASYKFFTKEKYGCKATSGFQL
ncbi:MAG: DUF6089 family protein [Ferruginibacter sp.]